MVMVRHGIAFALLLGVGLGCGEKQVVIETPPAPSEADLERMAPMLESQRQMMEAYRNRPESTPDSGGAVASPGGGE